MEGGSGFHVECNLFFSLATKWLTQVFFKGITGGGDKDRWDPPEP